jgi:hypothetical protein
MLAGARLCDDAAFPHSSSEQGLTDCVIDFVGASVRKIFALQVNLRATAMLA